MKCHTCGYRITTGARAVTPDSGSGARPTLYVHQTRAACDAARRRTR
ncbi:hypothetical protein ACFUJU_28670 [Streptomyces sp. NPDC057235]